jgi:pyruvyltransferase
MPVRVVNNTIKVRQCGGGNVGDMLTIPIVEYFLGVKAENVKDNDVNKLVGVGSILSWVPREGDVIWGSGLISDQVKTLPVNCKVLALRGKLSAKNIDSNCSTFGDPAVLLPLMYNPVVEKKYELGIIEHYVDKNLYTEQDGHRISVWQNWKNFVEDVKSCERIVCSSLHGCIISEAYDIPVEWVVLSNKVIGNGFKFRDYLSATDRKSFSETFDKKYIQNNLVRVLLNEFNSNN